MWDTEGKLLKKIMMAGLAVGALALNAPAASAGHATVNCRFNAVSQATATGQDTWEGAAEGYIVGNAGEAVSIRCVVKVNGAVRAATAWGSGTTAATTADRVTYVRTLTEVTQLCAQYTTAHGPGETCFATTTTQIPPQEVIDALDAVFDLLTEVEKTVIDPVVCPVLQSLNGSYGPIEIKPGTGGTGGDVYINGELWWDCPTYEPAV